MVSVLSLLTIVIALPSQVTPQSPSNTHPTAPSVVFGDELKGAQLDPVQPIVPPNGCSLMGGKGPVSDLSLLQNMSGWTLFLDHVKSDLGLHKAEWDRITVANLAFLNKVGGEQSYWCPDTNHTEWVSEEKEQCIINYQYAPITLGGIGEILTGNAKSIIQLGTTIEVTRSKIYQFGTQIYMKGKLEVSRYFSNLEWRLSAGEDVSQQASESVTQEISAAITSTNPYTDCIIALNLTTCQYTFKGTIPVLAVGWIWFHFPKRVKGHLNWGYKIDSIITNKTARSVVQTVHAHVLSTGRGTVNLVCDGTLIASNTTLNGTSIELSGHVSNNTVSSTANSITTTTTITT